MSFYDDASLVFLPSGGAGKDTKAYSIKPTDGSGDFTFSRGSNLTATRVDSNGLIEKGRENLLLQSNQFDTTWVTSGSPSLSSGQSGYDGSTDAWLYTNNGSEYIYQDNNTNVATYSIFAKKGNGGIGDFVLLFTDGVGGRYFDLDNGVLGSEVLTGLIDSKIELVSGTTDWYRCSITFASSTRVRVYASLADNDFTSVASIYIQDAQLEQGLVATDYIESGATKGKAGLLEQEPRFDYSGGASCPSLLLEPSRTNLIGYSEYLSGLSLFNSPTITQNYAVSPEGVQNAVRIQDTDGTNFKTIQTQFSISAGSTYTISVYVKKATSPITTYGAFYFDFDGGTRKISDLIFDEYNGTLVNALGNNITSVIHPVIDEGDYWRFSATATDTGSNTLLRATLRAGASANGTSLSLVTKDYTAYGFQCEQGSYPTSYIPNHSGGSVTREADLATGAGTSSTFNDDEGVLFIDLETTKNASPSQITINDGSYSNRVIFEVRPDAAFIKALINSGGSNVYEESVAAAPNTNYKVAIKYSANDIAFFVNGVKEASTTTTTAMPIGLADISFTGRENDGALRFVGNVKQTLVFNTALPDNQCIALTS